MARIAIGGLHHETNSFAPQPATFERFVEADGWPPLLRGPAMLPGTAGINLAITGFIDAARAAGHELVPLVWANACPSGPVTEDAFERLAAMLLADLAAAGPLDALFLDLHGAMVTEHLEDGEGELLRRLRAAAPAPADRGGARPARQPLRGDGGRTATRWSPTAPTRTSTSPPPARAACRCSSALMAGERSAKAWRRIDFLMPLPWQCTTIEPGRGALRAAWRSSRRTDVASASICMGFPAADTPVCGPAVLAYAADAATARRGGRSAGRRLRRSRAALRRPAVASRRGRRARHGGRRRPDDHPRRHAGQSRRRRQRRHDRAFWPR